MMLPPTSLPSEGQSAVYKRLWVHEVFRVFCDRLVDDAERVWLLQQVCTPSALLQAFTCLHTSAPSRPHPRSWPLLCDQLRNEGHRELYHPRDGTPGWHLWSVEYCPPVPCIQAILLK